MTSSRPTSSPVVPVVSNVVAPPFPVVGIGASAGGLAAFEAFFSGITDAQPGMAFVLVQHLAPDHDSLLVEIISRHTTMPVLEVRDGMAIQTNTVYVIPPNQYMSLANGLLHLQVPTVLRGLRLPINFFFHSLAQSMHERAIGIVLCGTGSDGTLGIRAIKAEGGLVLVEDIEFTEFDGMPRNAIATGLVDFVLPPAKMPAQLKAYIGRFFGKFSRPVNLGTPANEAALKKIFGLLRAQTGHDFSQYKTSTIYRRIDRRMVVNQITSLQEYAKYLQQLPIEIEALFRDLLIGVTCFFRDPEAFKVLEERSIPKLFEGKRPGESVRVWSTGCSVGVEAYSIAILLQEQLERLKTNTRVQVFATDIDSKAIAIARSGVFPVDIAADVTPERLARFFSLEPDGKRYRIHKKIRDMLVFSEHDMIKDPPFSKLDLISCRNLLIYLGPALQKQMIPLFHYALNSGGMLFLGTSESIGEFGDLFFTLDRKLKLYQRKDEPPRRIMGQFLPPIDAIGADITQVKEKPPYAMKLPLRELTEKALLEQIAPAGALVNALGDILYLHGRTGMYLELPAGEPSVNNILKMAREGLRRELTSALFKAASTNEIVRFAGLSVKTNGHFTTVNLSVRPVLGNFENPVKLPLFLVILEESTAVESRLLSPVTPTPPKDLHMLDLATDQRIVALKKELWAKEEYLQSTNEELETANEELKSSNEEMQSVNEELQSSNEEMETSKEELQSVNEELATVNAELQTKVIDLLQANNDMNNLLAGSGVATIFVDHALRIMRFTPAATRIINLIPTDVGRPVGHVVSNLQDYDHLIADTQNVLNTLMTKEVTVRTIDNSWFMMRILPYRTTENVIEGAVISFIDITALKITEAALHATVSDLHRMAVIVRDASDAITVQDCEGRILAWNPSASKMYGWSEAEALAMNVRELIPYALQDEALTKLQQLSRAEILAPYLTQRLTKGGTVIDISMTSTALIDEKGHMYGVATTERKQETKAPL